MNPTERAGGTPCTPMPKPSISPWPEHAFAERRRHADALGQQPAEAAFERKVSCGPPLGRGCRLHFVVSRRMDWLLFADGGRNATAVRRKGAAANCAVLKNRKNSHAPASPAAEAISDKGRPQRRSVKNRRPLIASKVPQASDSAKSQGRTRNRFTAAVFRLPFVRTKGNV